jgi:TPR repeat protein
MRHFANLRGAILASLLLVTIWGAAVAGPLEDAFEARQRSDYATEYRLLRPLAEEGNAAAQSGLGIMYENGHGVEQDHAEAVKWYRRAADQGYAVAQFNLGLMYENGRGVQRDEFEAAKWFRSAAEQGFAAAQNSLGLMYQNGHGMLQDFVYAYMWFNLAAAQNFQQAQINRDFLTERMTREQIAEAQKLAREWKAKLQ